VCISATPVIDLLIGIKNLWLSPSWVLRDIRLHYVKNICNDVYMKSVASETVSELWTACRFPPSTLIYYYYYARKAQNCINITSLSPKRNCLLKKITRTKRIKFKLRNSHFMLSIYEHWSSCIYQLRLEWYLRVGRIYKHCQLAIILRVHRFI